MRNSQANTDVIQTRHSNILSSSGFAFFSGYTNAHKLPGDYIHRYLLDLFYWKIFTSFRKIDCTSVMHIHVDKIEVLMYVPQTWQVLKRLVLTLKHTHVPNEAGPSVWWSKHPPLASYARCKYCMATSRYLAKRSNSSSVTRPQVSVMHDGPMEELIAYCQATECHVIFRRWGFILFDKILVLTVVLSMIQFQTFPGISLPEKLIVKSYKQTLAYRMSCEIETP